MKKLIYFVLILFVFSFAACKKSEEKPMDGKQQTAKNRQAKGNKRQKGKGGRPQALQIYKEDKLVIAIPQEEYIKMLNATVKVDGKEHKAMLLTELLKAHNVTGKSVILKGPNRAGSMTWDQVIETPIYIYPVKNRLQIHHEDEALKDKKIPVVLVRIDVADEPVATATKKGAK